MPGISFRGINDYRHCAVALDMGEALIPSECRIARAQFAAQFTGKTGDPKIHAEAESIATGAGRVESSGCQIQTTPKGRRFGTCK